MSGIVHFLVFLVVLGEVWGLDGRGCEDTLCPDFRTEGVGVFGARRSHVNSIEPTTTMTDPRKVTKSRFEFDENGETAWLEFDRDDQGWMTLWHTEVPPSLRGRGIAATLARTALEYARDEKLKVDVICPLVADYIRKNPEFDDLVGKKR